MNEEVTGKVCELCGTSADLQLHHISYDPEITQVLCVGCHQTQHPSHGVGKSDNAPMFDDLKDLYLHLRSVMTYRRSVAAKLGISEATAYLWDKRLGLLNPQPAFSKTLCSECGKCFGYLRHIGETDEEWVCRQCGEVTKTKKQEDQ